MSASYEPGARVALQTFLGTTYAPKDCRPTDNYWLLLGATGTVLTPPNAEKRVLVRWDVDVTGHGLACHNPEPNSLLIAEADLVALRRG